MNTNDLKKFSQNARRELKEQVAARLQQVLNVDSAEIREKQNALNELRDQIAQSSQSAVIERVAYTWFNRLSALRFMDVNHYTRLGIVSPQPGFTQPEILQQAKQGLIDEDLPVDHQRVFALLEGRLPSNNPQQEAYRLLLVAACNSYHQAMPFLFEPIADYTELLMPEDLLSENSVLQSLREVLDGESCQDVEVIGWLYQYYISERKDEVYADLKKNKKVQPEDIPAATQLFTPHWIVRYLVENSLGRLWMLNHPDSHLTDHMDYYISTNNAPLTNNHYLLSTNHPEELKILDPACGSGHMLTYAFDLLYQIYAEQGYDPIQIPQLILEKNLYGIEIDERAGGLAAFALTMKARAKDRRFLRRGVKPHICVMRNISFTAQEIDDYMRVVGRDLFTQDLWQSLKQFEDAKTFGSLIRPQIKDPSAIQARLEQQGVFGNLFLHSTNRKVEQVLEMSAYLSSRYHVVVANPPYMGGRNMDIDLKEFASTNYSESKSDLFAMFLERILELSEYMGNIGLVTPYVWMFLSTYENLREKIITIATIQTLVQLEYNAFSPAVIPACIFTLENKANPYYYGSYIRLTDFKGANNQSPRTLEAINNRECGWYYLSSSADFKKIPGSPIAYWVSKTFLELFSSSATINDISDFTGSQNITANNEKYLRYWYEVSQHKIGNKWVYYAKGGEYRKYYGNIIHCIDWSEEARDFYSSNLTSNLLDKKYWYREGITYTDITTRGFTARYLPDICVYDKAGPTFHPLVNLFEILSLVNTKAVNYALNILNPSMHCQVRDVKALPVPSLPNASKVINSGERLFEISKFDWDLFERSWGFCKSPLISENDLNMLLKDIYNSLRNYWREITLKMKALEEENNQIFTKFYGLQVDISDEVQLGDITLTCNPNYRYQITRRKTYSEIELESMLLADTMKELISYAVGCMFGRYSLDKPGLILANQGETARDYYQQVLEPTFSPDEDNVIPILDEGWFSDDITERFRQFLRLTFGEEHYNENLAFLENALGKDIRTYFLREFYDQHVKMYKKRPIYWLFSSPKGGFNALIYMHRYRPDTISIILNDYLRQFVKKLTAHRSHLERASLQESASKSQRTQALKEIDKIDKLLAELKEYEDEVLYPLAVQQIPIDLDDGVKVNYNKFGKALKKVSGLSE